MTKFTSLITAAALACLIAAPVLGVDSGGGSSGGGSSGGDTGGSSGGGSRKSNGPAAPSIDRARAAVDGENFQTAHDLLSQITAADPGNADAWNLLGFSSRKLGKMKSAAFAYKNALQINPKHLGELEYQGEMFLMLGELDKAQANLAKLQDLCGACEEAQDLAKAITKG